MTNYLWTPGFLADFRALSNTTLTDTCTFYPFNVPTDPASSTPTYVQNSEGSIVNTYNESNTAGDGPGTAVKYNVPCRVDVDVRGLIPQRMKEDVEAEKILRFVYLPLDYCTENQLVPKVDDQITTSAGDPLGRQVKYRVLDVNTESDEVDVQLLVEVVS